MCSIFQTIKFEFEKASLELRIPCLFFVVYHKLLKLVMDELLLQFVNHKMKSNDGRGHKSVTEWCVGTAIASLYFKLQTPVKYYQSFFYSPTDAQMSCIKKTILKFTLKQLRHVSVQSHHHQGAYYSCLLKLRLLK